MIVPHYTLAGSMTRRDTAKIELATKQLFRNVELAYTSRTVALPKTPFSVKVTAGEFGAVFDVLKGDQPGFINFCSFHADHAPVMLDQLRKLRNELARAGMPYPEPTTPAGTRWLYTMPLPQAVFSFAPAEMMLAGEIELYVWERLHAAFLATNQ